MWSLVSGDKNCRLHFDLSTDKSLVVKNPLSPVEHPGGEGVANELFELALDQFVKGVL